MKFLQTLIILLFLTVILSSCGFGEAGKVLRNEKVRTTDEFLIKKKDPITQPPDFDTIPEPGSIKKKEDSKNNIKDILKTNQRESTSNKSKSSSTEQSILQQIKK
tara:strand:+ start:93 stop:407 length:315 start_codon:yes stop_codon:yes gene_type:complete